MMDSIKDWVLENSFELSFEPEKNGMQTKNPVNLTVVSASHYIYIIYIYNINI